MLSKHLLFEAKAYLCWDAFPQLSVQLIPIDRSVAYYYPPTPQHHNIVIFYNPKEADFAEALFLLFHESGHVRQWKRYQQRGEIQYFYECLNRSNGQQKQIFEQEAWRYAEELLHRFCREKALDEFYIVQRFQDYRARCVQSYAE